MIPDNDLVSIVVPTCRRPELLPFTLASCLTQTHRNLEVIVVDDGAPHSAADVVATYRDARLRYLQNPVNQGLGPTLNRGFAVARGRYHTWIADDNEFADDAIELMLRALRDRQVRLVYTDLLKVECADVVSLRQASGATRFRPPSTRHIAEGAIGACFLYDRDIRDQVGDYATDTPLLEDYDYWIRIAQVTRLSHLDAAPFYYRTFPGTLSSQRTFEVGVLFVLVRFRYALHSHLRSWVSMFQFLRRSPEFAEPQRWRTGRPPSGRYARAIAAAWLTAARFAPLTLAYRLRWLGWADFQRRVLRAFGSGNA
ncbi:MAG: glycosyltransferase family 2 protein [Rhodanobacter sp.]